MAGGAIIGELEGLVIRVGGLVVVRLVASGTGVRCVVVVAIVAGRTVVGDGGVSPVQRIIIIVDGEGGRGPSGIGGMAAGTIHRKSEYGVVGVGRLFKVHHMAG